MKHLFAIPVALLFAAVAYGSERPNIVLILAASEHRAAAFEAAAWCIAELKERVPIWKKEYTRSGQVWVDGGPSQ